MGKTFRRNDYHRPRGGKLKNKKFKKLKEFEEDKYHKHDQKPSIVDVENDYDSIE